MTLPITVDDPGQPEALSPADFAATMIDRRRFHSPLVKIGDKRLPYSPRSRPWSQVRGITLHQTACDMGERIERYDTIGAHFAVLRSGRVLWMADLDRVVIHGNGWNAQCVGIEVNGLYAGLDDDPDTAQDEALRTTWDDPTTPTREQPMQVTPAAMRSTRQLCRWLVAEVARNGGHLGVLGAHRQASGSRRNDPCQTIWREVALPVTAELGLTDGGVGFFLSNPEEAGGNGYPIPEAWDPRCKGIKY